MLQAIETKYNGYRFRSRTEARWAVFFDAVGARWAYEYQGFDLGNGHCYLPDFLLGDMDIIDKSMWVEIKGPKPSDIEQQKIEKLAVGTNRVGLMVFGSPGDERYMLVEPSNGYWFKDADINNYPVWCDFLECQEYWTWMWHYFFRIYPSEIGILKTWEDIALKYGSTWISTEMQRKEFVAFEESHRHKCQWLSQAYEAARSARFEHGETPRVQRGKLRN